METAENAIQASLTGHLVFSTLHTNDAAGAYTRMVDMGVEPFLVASTVEGVMAQRLVRRLCPHCKEAYTPEDADLPTDFPRDKLAEIGGKLYPQPRLPRLPQCRLCRPNGHLRAAGDDRQNSPVGPRPLPALGKSPKPPSPTA